MPAHVHPASPRIHTPPEPEGEGQGGVKGPRYTHALDESTKVFHLGSKKQVAELGVGKEYNEEHDSKAQDVLGTAGQRGGELCHGFVEADVLEYLEGPC